MNTARARVTSVEALNGELRSPLTGVPNLAWNKFVDALMIDDDRGPHKGRPRPFNARSHAGGLGCFALLPRRLVELHILKEVAFSKGKALAKNDKWLVVFFANPISQYKALAVSLMRYSTALTSLPEGMSRSGALALHHRLGPNALVKWQKHQQPSTLALFRRANGLF